MDIKLINSSDGDWEGLYIDNLLVLEQHSISAKDLLLNLNGLSDIYAEFFEEKGNWVEQQGGFCTHFWNNKEMTQYEISN